MFNLTEAHLRTLFDANEFAIPDAEMVYVGIRGCLPETPDDHAFRSAQNVTAATVNHRNPRCTLIQWRPGKGDFAVYPGSTVPHVNYIEKARRNGGNGANQLFSGYYTDYRKGTHLAGKPTGHAAFRQNAERPIRRTADDLEYENTDRVEIENPGDNMHAAWCQSVNGDHSSAGCQVIVGLPKCAKRTGLPAVGPWKVFHERAYALPQDRFAYALVDCTYLKQIALHTGAVVERVRFGSNGPRATRVQKALEAKGFYEGLVDGDFRGRSVRALLDYQQAVFGGGEADGVCGPVTAETLGINWP